MRGSGLRKHSCLGGAGRGRAGLDWAGPVPGQARLGAWPDRTRPCQVGPAWTRLGPGQASLAQPGPGRTARLGWAGPDKNYEAQTERILTAQSLTVCEQSQHDLPGTSQWSYKCCSRFGYKEHLEALEELVDSVGNQIDFLCSPPSSNGWTD